MVDLNTLYVRDAKSGQLVPWGGSNPTFSKDDYLVRPANTNAYAINKSINMNGTISQVAYTLKVVTVKCTAHGLVTNDRVTIAGVNTGATLTNVDGNWIVTVIDADHFSFTVAVQPTGTTPQTGLTITGAVAKQLSLDVAGIAGGGIILSRLSLACQGVAMLGSYIRVYIYTAQQTALVDQSTFTLLNANDTYRKDYIDLNPITEGSGSDVTFASQRLWEVFKCEAVDTRLYFRLSAQGALTPVSGGEITLRASGIQLLG